MNLRCKKGSIIKGVLYCDDGEIYNLMNASHITQNNLVVLIEFVPKFNKYDIVKIFYF